MQQLKLLGIGAGEVKHLKASNVLNVVTVVQLEMGADLSRRQKPDRFREVGFGETVRIGRERVASAD